MNKKQAKYIASRLEATGHKGEVVRYEINNRQSWGVSYDGCGHQGHPWGCPRNTSNAEEFNGSHTWPCGVTIPALPPSLQAVR